ncbi:MAG: GNAT family N-acetyltransferase [Bryobacteraceae bacterium]|nr:GNAT family N-acetyltransferase [Bryobacteraceae bacterium]
MALEAVLPAAPESMELDGGLFLRPLTLGDAPIVFDAVQGERSDLRTWLPWVDQTETVADTIRFIEEAAQRRLEGSALVYALWLDLEFAGVVDLHAIDHENGCAQIGYWLRCAARGQGLATQASMALLGIAFEILGLERVEIRCAVANEPSQAIPQRLGFVLEGTLRHAQKLVDGHSDLRVYGLLAQEYRQALHEFERG